MGTERQIMYLGKYKAGFTMQEIADMYNVNKSTVSRVISRSMRYKCPFSTNCLKCPLPDCAIKDEYADLVNNTEDKRCLDKRRTTNRRKPARDLR